MSLRSPRRIFARKRRLSGAALALRSCAVLAVGLTASLGAALVADRRPAGPQASETLLPAISEAAPLQREDPVMRLAAARPRPDPKDEQDREPGQRTPRTEP